MKTFAKVALGALMLAGAATAVASSPADARVVVGVGIGAPGYYGGGYYGGGYYGGPSCYRYYDPYYCGGGYYGPAYYGGYYGAPVIGLGFGGGWGHGYRGGWHGGGGGGWHGGGGGWHGGGGHHR